MNVVSAVTGNRMVRILNQFIYLFKENRSGYSWPQTIPPLSTSPYDTPGVVCLVRLGSITDP